MRVKLKSKSLNIVQIKAYRKDNIVKVCLFLQLLFALVCFAFIYCEFSNLFYRNLLLFVLFECTVISFVGKIFNVFQVFLAMSVFFNFSRVILDFLKDYDIQNFYYAGANVRIPEKIMTESYKVYIVILLGTSIGWLFGMRLWNLYKQNKVSKVNIQNSSNYSIILKRFILVLFIIASLLYLVKGIQILQVAHRLGYSWRTASQNLLTFPWYLAGAGTLFNVFGPLQLFYCRTKKDFLLSSSLIMLVLSVHMLTGVRSVTMYTLVALILIWIHYFSDIKIKYLAFFGIAAVIAMIFVDAYRVNGSESTPVIQFLWNQGISFCVLPLLLYFRNSFSNTVPFAFGYIVDMFSSISVRTLETIELDHRLTQHLMYQLNPYIYAANINIGTSQSAELYDLFQGNKIAIFLSSMAIILLLMYIMNNLYKNPLIFYVGFLYLCLFIYSPRYTVFYMFYKPYLYGAIIALIITVFEKALLGYKKKEMDLLVQTNQSNYS